MTVAGAKVPFGNCRMKPALATFMSVTWTAAVGDLAFGEIALLHRQMAEVVERHGADLAQLADEEVGQAAAAAEPAMATGRRCSGSGADAAGAGRR